MGSNRFFFKGVEERIHRNPKSGFRKSKILGFVFLEQEYGTGGLIAYGTGGLVPYGTGGLIPYGTGVLIPGKIWVFTILENAGFNHRKWRFFASK